MGFVGRMFERARSSSGRARDLEHDISRIVDGAAFGPWHPVVVVAADSYALAAPFARELAVKIEREFQGAVAETTYRRTSDDEARRSGEPVRLRETLQVLVRGLVDVSLDDVRDFARRWSRGRAPQVVVR